MGTSRICNKPDYFLNLWKILVWDARILYDEAVYVINLYAIN